jgi:hypothetical protein
MRIEPLGSLRIAFLSNPRRMAVSEALYAFFNSTLGAMS